MKTKRIISVVLLLIIIAGVFPGCKDDDSKTFQTMQDFEQAKIGVMTGSSFEMLVTVEYSEEQNDADVVIRYDGKSFDPCTTDNDLSLTLAKKASAEIVYQYAPDQKLGNIVKAQI